MDSGERRENIYSFLKAQDAPASASSIARMMGVSRQIIVGDIALLRAQGIDIIATARGYTLAKNLPTSRYVGKIACQHSFDNTEKELMAIVEEGGEILNVVVDHYLYGEMAGQLNIASARDVEAFMDKVRKNEARLLSELTGGVHLHTVACRDRSHFEAIHQKLKSLGLLYEEE